MYTICFLVVAKDFDLPISVSYISGSICSNVGQLAVPNLGYKISYPEKYFLYFLKKLCPKKLLIFWNEALFHIFTKLFVPFDKSLLCFYKKLSSPKPGFFLYFPTFWDEC